MTSTLSTRLKAGAAFVVLSGSLMAVGYKANRDRMVHGAVEDRLRNAPCVSMKYTGRFSTMLDIARGATASNDIPRYVPDMFSVDTAADMYLREVVRRTRELRPEYKLGDRGLIVLPDLRGDKAIASR